MTQIEKMLLELLLKQFKPMEVFIDEDFPNGVGANHGTCATDKYVAACLNYKAGLKTLKNNLENGEARK